MGVAENEEPNAVMYAEHHKHEADVDVQGVPRSPTPGSPRPEDLPTQPHYPQSSNAPLVKDDAANDGDGVERKHGASPPSLHGDDASNESSCSKR